MVKRIAVVLIGAGGIAVFWLWFFKDYAWLRELGVVGTQLNLFFVGVLIAVAITTLALIYWVRRLLDD